MNTVDGAGESRNVREWLRSLAVFAGPLAQFDPADAPTEPVELFLRWLQEAVAAGVPDPSFKVWIESAGRLSKCSCNPLGQRICTEFTLVAEPRPKWTRMSLLEL